MSSTDYDIRPALSRPAAPTGDGIVIVSISLKRSQVADIDRAAADFLSNRSTIVRLAVAEFLIRWRNVKAQSGQPSAADVVAPATV